MPKQNQQTTNSLHRTQLLSFQTFHPSTSMCSCIKLRKDWTLWKWRRTKKAN